MADDRHEVAFVIGAILGAVGGAAYGLFNAPQAGWRTRADLSFLAEELGDRLALRLKTAAANVRSVFEDDDPDTRETGIFYFPAEPPATPEPAPDVPATPSLEGVNAP